MSLEPGYARKSARIEAGSGASCADDLADFASAFAASPWLWDALPFHELFDPALADRFASGTEGAAGSSWSAEAAIAFARRYGSDPLDLVLPSEARLALRRELARSGDTVSDLLVLEGSTGAAALDLFGSAGARPLTERFEYDEYSVRSSFALRFPADGSGLSAKASASALATFTDPGGQAWRLEERAVVDRDRDGTTWSSSLAGAASLRPSRSWLSDLLSWMLDRAGPRPAEAEAGIAESAGPGGGEKEGGASVVSEYLALVAEAPRVPITAFDLGLELSSPERSGAQLVAKLTESWTERVVARERLVIETKLSMAQGLSVEDGAALPFAELAASLSLKVIF
jgi:hypothetical protein